MNDTIKKKCLMCNEEFSVSRDQLWKFLCPTHTQEFYVPLRRNHSFQSALQLIEVQKRRRNCRVAEAEGDSGGVGGEGEPLETEVHLFCVKGR